jgi:hypothetical protein
MFGKLLPRAIAAASAALLVMLFASQIAALLMMNVAQLLRLHGETRIDLFNQALNIAPQNRHIRLQAGNAHIQNGDDSVAAVMLSPLILPNPENQDKLSMIIALAGSGRVTESIAIFKDSGLAEKLPRGVALHMLDAAMGMPHLRLSNADALGLYRRSFALGDTLEANRFFDARFNPSKAMDNSQLFRTDWGWRVVVPRTPLSTPLSQIDCAMSKSQLSNIVAQKIHLNATDIALGNNAIGSGDFENVNFETDQFVGWRESYMSTGHPWNFGLFVMGPDWGGCSDGKRMMRIEGLYVDHLNAKEPSRAGLWGSEFLVPPKTPYVITFLYRTEGVPDYSATLYLEDSSKSFDRGEVVLPPSDGKWQRVVLIAWNATPQTAKIMPLLRSFSEGSVAFDNFEAYVISSQKIITPTSSELSIVNP